MTQAVTLIRELRLPLYSMHNAHLAGIAVIGLIVVGALLIFVSPSTPASSLTSTTTTSMATSTLSGTVVESVQARPEVTTSSLVVVSSTTALVNGKVNPQGAPTTYWYDYGRTTALGMRTPIQTLGGGFSTLSAPALLSQLRSDTQYYFRLSAKNAFGSASGSVYALTTNNNPPLTGTAPEARTVSTTNARDTSATLRASVTPSNSAAIYWFEYGTTTTLGFVTDPASAGSGSSAESVSASLTALAPRTTYYFRVNAQNQFGTRNGAVLSFTTHGTSTAPINP